MLRRTTARRLIALVAAYALALQAIVAALALGAPAVAGIICATPAHGGADRAPTPVAPGHDLGCSICPLACASTLAPPPHAATIAWHADAGEKIAPPAWSRPSLRAPARSGLARAPPA